ncbi:hypothetical protein [Tardiphaga sp.]
MPDLRGVSEMLAITSILQFFGATSSLRGGSLRNHEWRELQLTAM